MRMAALNQHAPSPLGSNNSVSYVLPSATAPPAPAPRAEKKPAAGVARVLFTKNGKNSRRRVVRRGPATIKTLNLRDPPPPGHLRSLCVLPLS
ncbi:hypothetical protein EVAR_33932_1 [Eumeta japonica]|uniref:Uncharacterized protein n=1 Tax=Eumeta variegata TaxID=151549 RepID=A0A4C1VZQ7_EUMVA|nr:hypothetical protein EVAR_33932_1 [Eumeta japonica]